MISSLFIIELLVMILAGKSSGKPKYGCPFCSACTPYKTDGSLYTLANLLEHHQVNIANYYFYCKLMNHIMSIGLFINYSVFFSTFQTPPQLWYQNDKIPYPKSRNSSFTRMLQTSLSDKQILKILGVPELHLLIGKFT